MNQHPARSRSQDGPAGHPSARLGANMISVASGKGGVGKTWFAITLAHTMRRAGRKVLLFDGDLGLANVDIQLGLSPARDLSEALTGQASFRDVVTQDPATGVDVVAGRSGTARLADAGAAQLDMLRRGLKLVGDTYDSVILDLGAGVDRAVRTLAANAGPLLVVTNEEPTAITDAYALIKLIHGADAGADIRVVINLASNQRDGERTYEKLRTACENFLGFAPSLAGIVRRDSRVPDAIRRQTPLLKRHPTSLAGEDVERIARGLTG
ncbi:MAG: cobyrinic acid a,c-diamide synthase [Rhizobiales bacterium NRL2]|jgi:flagellar biosynthesis protein FlhG|nr:MAG: cobyrinic acid a,c-diamide synthase [Rhizobiales bacterium NRL2]